MPRQPYSITAAPTSFPQSEAMLPAKTGVDAEVDIEILRTVPKLFAIEDEGSANWLVKKIIAARGYADRVKEWAEQELSRAAREEQTLLFLYGKQLERWSKDQIESSDGKRKSIALPAGTVGFRTINPSLQVDDEAQVIQWARENCPLAVVVVEKLSRSALKEHFDSTGEIPDSGAHIDAGGERFSIR